MKSHGIGVMLDSFKKPFREALRLAADTGANALQLPAIGAGFNPLGMSAAERRETLARIKDAGLCVSAICGDLGGHGFTRAEDNPKKITTSKRILELALDFEAKVVTTHIGVVPETSDFTRETLLLACRELGEFAEKTGAGFAIETGPETPEVLCGFIDSLGCGGVGVNYDPANLVMVTGVDPVAGVAALKGKILHTHAKDGIMKKQTAPSVIYGFFADGGIEDLRMEDYFLELPLGQGKVDFPAWINALDAVGYSGYLTVEREVGASPEKDIAAAVQYLKGIMAI